MALIVVIVTRYENRFKQRVQRLQYAIKEKLWKYGTILGDIDAHFTAHAQKWR